MCRRERIDLVPVYTRNEFLTPIGLLIPALPGGSGGNAQSGGGAGGGPFTSVGILLFATALG
jgi:hypothetical protein